MKPKRGRKSISAAGWLVKNPLQAVKQHSSGSTIIDNRDVTIKYEHSSPGDMITFIIREKTQPKQRSAAML